MDFSTWFQAWLAAHPLKRPDDAARSPYTAEVMRQVRALHELAAPRRLARPVWTGWLTLTAGLATVAVALVVVLTLTPGSRTQTARVAPTASGALIRLAESSGDESWLDQTTQLLDELNEDASTDGADEDSASDDDWLKELDTLDQDTHPAS